jgi:hypothetical protein
MMRKGTSKEGMTHRVSASIAAQHSSVKASTPPATGCGASVVRPARVSRPPSPTLDGFPTSSGAAAVHYRKPTLITRSAAQSLQRRALFMAPLSARPAGCGLLTAGQSGHMHAQLLPSYTLSSYPPLRSLPPHLQRRQQRHEQRALAQRPQPTQRLAQSHAGLQPGAATGPKATG